MQSPNDEGTAIEGHTSYRSAHLPAGHEGGGLVVNKSAAPKSQTLKPWQVAPADDLLQRAAATARGATFRIASPRLARGSGATLGGTHQSFNKTLHNN
jgi:hypothetical protein